MAEHMQEIKRLMQEAIEDGVFPSASLLISKDREVVFNENFGSATDNTIFDVASLTKPVITTTLAMIALSGGLLDLRRDVAEFFPSSPHLSSVTIFNLLNHSSGLAWWQPYYQEVPESDVASKTGRKQIIDAILQEQIEYETGSKSVYSDLNFILLGLILEKIFSKPLHLLAEDMITNPLDMKNSFYRPIAKTPWSESNFDPAYDIGERSFIGIEFAPTEDCPWRREVVKGYVHDQNCYAMGGVAGHSGLFSTADDLNRFISKLVDGYSRGNDLLLKDVVRRFIDFQNSGTPELRHPDTFLLGWDRPAHENSQAGHYFSGNSIGHLGYTGCSLWIDLEKDLWVILLTNRIHPSSTNQKIKAFRPILHDAVLYKSSV